ncbi:hypothetical protein IAU60_002502 [Kwoniella sp. DSM 27419]
MAAKQRQGPTRTLFVTVGSTLFPVLTDTILSPGALAVLAREGVTRLVVQYGRAQLPETLEVVLDASGSGIAHFDAGSPEPMSVEVMRYTDDFKGMVRRSDGVISHAGSGSILTVLRQTPPRPLLIVPNESLMDNHQAELADEMGHLGHLMVSRVSDLVDTLPRFLGQDWQSTIRPFPPTDPARFRGIMDEMMGFV